MKRFLLVASLFLLSLPVLSLAQDPAAGGLDIAVPQLLSALVGAVSSGQWPVAVTLAFVGVIWVLRAGGARWLPWLATSEGGTVLAGLTVMASVLGAAALAPGAAISWGLVGKAAVAAFGAIGAWTGVRRLLRLLLPLVAKLPGVGPALAQLLSFLSGADAPAKVEAAAAQAYKPLRPAPTVDQAAAELGRPPSRL